MLNERFALNLGLFEKKNPLLALQVHHMPTIKKSPFRAQVACGDLCFEGVDVVYVYGLDEQVYSSLISWLLQKEKRKLIFLEDSLAVFRFFLDQENSQKALKDEQVDICFLTGNGEDTLKELAWNHLFMPYRFISAPSFDTKRERRAKMLKISLDELSLGAGCTLSYYKDYGIETMRNQWRN